ncbi:CLUMA_CG017264, isoform A [Clunio marinus]|uniref:CLUMA_CG017264, isoform A n=1 Tax=Clunio marinus TaxID=568069 RepID=A0A1J1IZY3_9DIPT|nr:CLUMA_CG017264, isoform A [Clunio marinus]
MLIATIYELVRIVESFVIDALCSFNCTVKILLFLTSASTMNLLNTNKTISISTTVDDEVIRQSSRFTFGLFVYRHNPCVMLHKESTHMLVDRAN